MKSEINMILMQRLWQGVSGLVTMLLLTHFLTLAEQGWYYSFLSLVALFTLFDLGLSIVLVQFSAHLFIKLRWLYKGGVAGEGREQFFSLLTQSVRVYLWLGLAFCFLMIPAGLIFFGLKSSRDLLIWDWRWSWVCLVIFTAFNILTLPFLALIEGSGRVAEIYGLRLLQGLLGAIVCWCILIAGGGLWASSAIPFLSALTVIFWLIIRNPILLRRAFLFQDAHVKWGREIWPLQWRIGVSWVSGYFLTQIYTPILFYFQGAEAAGQMGLSLTVANMLGLLAQSWIARRVPQMAQAAGKRDWKELDRVFTKDFLYSLGAFVIGAAVLVVLYFLIVETAYIHRVLPIWSFFGLVGVVFVNHVIGALAAHLRSYKKEPLIWVSLLGAVFTVFSAFFAAKRSVGDLIFVMLLVQLIIVLPMSVYMWRRFNIEWRRTNAG